MTADTGSGAGASPDAGAGSAAGSTPAARKPSAGGRIKALSILAVLVLSGLTFLAWSQSWGSLLIAGGTTTEASLDVPGSAAAPALSALGLAGIALAGALAIAGPIIRIVLGALEVLLGASVLWSALGALNDPVAAGASVVTTSTGVAGLGSIRELVTAGPASPWPAVTVVLGIAMMIAGIAVVATVRRWPAASRKYQAVTFEGAGGRQSGDPADFFDDEPDDERDETDDTTGTGMGNATRTATAGNAETRDPSAGQAPAGEAPETDDPLRRARDAAVDDWDSLSRGTDPTR